MYIRLHASLMKSYQQHYLDIHLTFSTSRLQVHIPSTYASKIQNNTDCCVSVFVQWSDKGPYTDPDKVTQSLLIDMNVGEEHSIYLFFFTFPLNDNVLTRLFNIDTIFNKKKKLLSSYILSYHS